MLLGGAAYSPRTVYDPACARYEFGDGAPSLAAHIDRFVSKHLGGA